MANPITWRNVSGPSLGGNPVAGVGAAAYTINEGIDRLTGVIQDRNDRIEDQNTQNYLDAVARMQLDGFDNQAAQLEALRNAGPIDQAAIRGAVADQRATLQNQAVAQRNFELGEARAVANPVYEQIQALVANKDYEGARALAGENKGVLDTALLSGDVESLITSGITADTNKTLKEQGEIFDADTEALVAAEELAVSQAEKAFPVQTVYTSLGENQKEVGDVVRMFEGNKYLANDKFLSGDGGGTKFIEGIIDEVAGMEQVAGIPRGVLYALMEKTAEGIGKAGDGWFDNNDIADLDRDQLKNMLLGHAVRYSENKDNQNKVEAAQRKLTDLIGNRGRMSARIKQGKSIEDLVASQTPSQSQASQAQASQEFAVDTTALDNLTAENAALQAQIAELMAAQNAGSGQPAQEEQRGWFPSSRIFHDWIDQNRETGRSFNPRSR